MGLEAATKALLDAGITYDDIRVAFVGYVCPSPLPLWVFWASRSSDGI